MSKSKLEAMLKAARPKAGNFEFATPEWESAMEVVRSLVDAINSQFPVAPWSDKEWQEMMSR